MKQLQWLLQGPVASNERKVEMMKKVLLSSPDSLAGREHEPSESLTKMKIFPLARDTELNIALTLNNSNARLYKIRFSNSYLLYFYILLYILYLYKLYFYIYYLFILVLNLENFFFLTLHNLKKLLFFQIKNKNEAQLIRWLSIRFSRPKRL